MSSRSHFGASNPTVKQSSYGFAGGSKKQGLVPSNYRYHDVVRFIKTKAVGTPVTRQTIFCVNMLGGVGAGKSQFNVAGTYTNKDGVHCQKPYFFWSRNPRPRT